VKGGATSMSKNIIQIKHLARKGVGISLLVNKYPKGPQIEDLSAEREIISLLMYIFDDLCCVRY
jgi:hypothetical protein